MTDTDTDFAVFWDAHHERIRHALALTFADRALASEATDEAMVRAYQRWSRVGDLEDPAGWVYRVGYNWATSWLRKLRRRPTRSEAQLDRPVTDRPSDPDLLAAVLALPERHRAVIVLRFYLDWPIDRIAASLGVPPGTVKSRLHRALASLREREEIHT